MNPVDFSSSMLATLGTLGRGTASTNRAQQPKELLKLYEMEGCPFSRLVREALTELDLDVMVYPCPKNGKRFRPLVAAMGGKQQFPYLYDPNTDTGLYEADQIIQYLYQHYGSKGAPAPWQIKAIKTLGSLIASSVRGGKGLRVRAAKKNEKPLILYSFEASPFARPVRELLTELELNYELKQVGRTQGSDWLLPPMRKRLAPDYTPSQRNRRELLERTGRVAVPYLIDPNTGMDLYESADIVAYLKGAYAK